MDELNGTRGNRNTEKPNQERAGRQGPPWVERGIPRRPGLRACMLLYGAVRRAAAFPANPGLGYWNYLGEAGFGSGGIFAWVENAAISLSGKANTGPNSLRGPQPAPNGQR